MCTDLFGKNYTTAVLQKSIDRVNYQFGGADFYNVTNVVIPNGSLDPWHVLGIRTSNHPSVVPYLIKGTAHCAEMYPPRDEDSPELIRARKVIEENIDKWLAPSPTRTTIEMSTTKSTKETTTKVPGQHSTSLLGFTFTINLLVALALVFC
ncbi:unnamed protein product [Strongylus vulgaris]|uniref:Serine carboxypeptidase S28 n=1 Tax=Strongylus vulgaris TaxID=40348 RepID=A0A3P7KZD6_STRVU|nr:unnamed protein product [Strongylus vulgaris]